MYTGATDKLALPKKRQRNELSTVILRAIILFSTFNWHPNLVLNLEFASGNS